MTDVLAGAFNATELRAQHFDPVEYIVPGMIPEGLSLLVAAPKIGKSWLVLGLAAAAAAGGTAFGALRVSQRPVLYLALEDGPRRLKDRLTSIQAPQALDQLTFLTELTGSVLDVVEAFLQAHEGSKPLVILDTLGKVMPPARPNEPQYERDYRIGSALKRAIDSVPGAALIVVHHTRKAQAEDFVETASGTNGLTGAADTIMVLRRERNSANATLSVTSRDAAEGEYALTIDDHGHWRLEGATLADAKRAARTHTATAKLGDGSAAIVELLNQFPNGVSARDASLASGMDEHYVRNILVRMHKANRIQRVGRGLYAPLPMTPGASDASDANQGSNAPLASLASAS
ncbi:AAA family ATPase [Demequina iriomotensis]|uniref:AAA family ATPase n=1 Tax=Demequina iriomotensis TaxID=1536641 RepID=UPI000782B120|nr:AAA family ATPase [Demequina iriomotensis]